MKITYEKKKIDVEPGITVEEALKDEIKRNKYQVMECRYNNEYKIVGTQIEEDAKIELIDTSAKEGIKVYVRTLVYIMGKAFESLYPKEKIMVEYQLGSSMFCKCDKVPITNSFLKNLKEKDEIQYIYKNFKEEYIVEKNIIIKDTNWDYLKPTNQNTITLITCVENEPEYRRCIVGISK